MFGSIRSKSIMGFSIILVVLISNMLYNLVIYRDSKMHLLHIRENTIASFGYASKMKINIIQISEYVTDVSASKNTGHLSDAKKTMIFTKSIPMHF